MTSTTTTPVDPPAPTEAAVNATAAGATSACALVTRGEAGTAVGHDPGAGRAIKQLSSTQCQYGTYQKGFVLVNLTPTRGKVGYDKVHDSSLAQADIHVRELSGLGDRAFEVTGPSTAGIYVDKGDQLIVVTISLLADKTPPTAQVLALARAAAGRA